MIMYLNSQMSCYGEEHKVTYSGQTVKDENITWDLILDYKFGSEIAKQCVCLSSCFLIFFVLSFYLLFIF